MVAWPFPPDWTDAITERFSWLTAIQTAQTGAEQRQALRVAPRRQLDYPIMLTDQERSYFEVLIARNGGTVWDVPLPHEEVPVGPVDVGTTLFAMDTAYRQIAVGTKVLIRARDAFVSELAEVTSMDSSTITTLPTQLQYDAATITPTFQGVITEKPEIARRTARICTGIVRFMSVEPMVWPVASRSLAGFATTFRASGISPFYPVLTDEPNAINDLTYSYERMWSKIDNNQSIPRYSDQALRQFASQQYEWFLFGRQERQDFLDRLFYLQGRFKPIWVPTFNDDLAISQGYPNPLGWTDAAPPPGREFFLQFRRDGTVHGYSSTAFSGGVPGLTFDDATVQRNSFMSLKRLDSDDIEVTHKTAADGVATVSAVFRDAPDLRRPLTFTSLAFRNSGYIVGDVRSAATNTSTGLTDTVTVTGAAGGAP